jgi:O-6-methylguanine DNA methyltransferase
MKITCVAQAAIRGRAAEYARIATPFGPALLAVSGGEICWLDFPRNLDDDGPDDAVAKLARYWKGGTLAEARDGLKAHAAALFGGRPQALSLLLVGTPFQHEVWRALAAIPAGETLSYGRLAALTGRPKAARATGGAVGSNPVVYFIPCHRVLAGDGSLHGFGCGLEMKTKLLEAEGFKAAA